MFLLHSKKIPLDEKLELITALINLGYKLALAKQPDYFDRMFDLYKIGIDEGVWTQYGTISERTFRNIVTVGASTGRFDWTKKYIKDNNLYLPNNKRDKITYYTKAYVEFHIGSYEKAMELLDMPQQLSLEDKLTFKSLYSRCLYEFRCEKNNSGYENILDTFLSNFSKFLRRRKLSEERKYAYQNFIKIIRILNNEQMLLPVSEKRKDLLRKRLASYSEVIAYQWIYDKINEL